MVMSVLQPISECEVSISELIEKIQPDRWPVPQGQRPLRSIGAALSVAITLLEVKIVMEYDLNRFI